ETLGDEETGHRFPRRPERRSIALRADPAERAAPLGEIEHDAGGRALQLRSEVSIVPLDGADHRPHGGDGVEHDIVNSEHLDLPASLAPRARNGCMPHAIARSAAQGPGAAVRPRRAAASWQR